MSGAGPFIVGGPWKGFVAALSVAAGVDPKKARKAIARRRRGLGFVSTTKARRAS